MTNPGVVNFNANFVGFGWRYLNILNRQIFSGLPSYSSLCMVDMVNRTSEHEVDVGLERITHTLQVMVFMGGVQLTGDLDDIIFGGGISLFPLYQRAY